MLKHPWTTSVCVRVCLVKMLLPCAHVQNPLSGLMLTTFATVSFWASVAKATCHVHASGDFLYVLRQFSLLVTRGAHH